MTVKKLKLSIAEIKNSGPEIYFTKEDMPTTDKERESVLLGRLNFYNYVCNKKQAKQFAIEWLAINGNKKLAKKLNSVTDSMFSATHGHIARMALVGWVLDDHEKNEIISKAEEAVKLHKDKGGTVNPGKEKKKHPNIQEIMREKAMLAAGELDYELDKFIDAKCKGKDAHGKIIEILTRFNILPQHVNLIKHIFNEYIEEFSHALEIPTEKELKQYDEVEQDLILQQVESYSHLTKPQLKNLIKYCQKIIEEMDGYIHYKKSKVVRRRRSQTPERKVRDLKYLKEFKELNLESVSPVAIIGASEVWLYNTKNRKIQYYVVDKFSRSFTVKGTTLIGYNSNNSKQKTLRKPEEFFVAFKKAGKPDRRNLFTELKTTPIGVNGRFNKNLIILKAT
tara:strand:+ start:3483 stop:4664 length:1182 start_codon:yes stop_codon:yes gene_type:complete